MSEDVCSVCGEDQGATGLLLVATRWRDTEINRLRAELEAVKAERLTLADVVDQWNRTAKGICDARKSQAAMSREDMDNRPVRKASRRHGQACKALSVAGPLARRILSESTPTPEATDER